MLSLEDEMISFPAWSAGCPDGLKPQHLKDQIGPAVSPTFHQNLVSVLTSFCNLAFQEIIPLKSVHFSLGLL